MINEKECGACVHAHWNYSVYWDDMYWCDKYLVTLKEYGPYIMRCAQCIKEGNNETNRHH